MLIGRIFPKNNVVYHYNTQILKLSIDLVMWHDRRTKIKKSDKRTEERRLAPTKENLLKVKVPYRYSGQHGSHSGTTQGLFHYCPNKKIPNARRNISRFWTSPKGGIDPARGRISSGKREVTELLTIQMNLQHSKNSSAVLQDIHL